MTDLDKLIDAVEGGRVQYLDPRFICDCLGLDFPNGIIGYILKAENGSGFSATILHSKLIPDFWWTHYNDGRCEVGRDAPNEIKYSSFVNGNTDRSHTSAILKAYRAQVQK